MATAPRSFFDGVRYVGRVRAARATYEVYDAGKRYLLVWPSRRARGSYFLSEVPSSFVERVWRRFRGGITTSVEVRKRLGGPPFRQLGALLTLVAGRRARIVGRRGRSLAFRVLSRT